AYEKQEIRDASGNIFCKNWQTIPFNKQNASGR
ncbi:unnamed protein product, partial [marine sediment metagenome]